jgi:prophage regulatory protein
MLISTKEQWCSLVKEQEASMPTKILRLPQVIEYTGLSRSSILEMAKTGSLNFPKPIKIGKRAIGWRSHDIEVWLSDRLEIAEGNDHAA